MFIEEEQYDILENERAFGFFYFLKIFFRIFIVLVIIFFIHLYIKYNDEIYDSKNGAHVYISKTIIKIEQLVQENIDKDFYKNSNCNDMNIVDLSQNPYCDLISSKENFYIHFNKENIFLKDVKNDKEIKLCSTNECKVIFNHDDIIINLIGD